jgi:hypothetical protein
MEQHGAMRTPIICINKSISGKKEAYILDGQHMITALTRAGIDTVKCMVTEIEDTVKMVKAMATLNSVVNKWNLVDYADAFAALNNQHYLRVKQIMLVHGFTAPITALILGNKDYKVFKSGRFKANNKDADKLIRYINDCCIVLGTKRSRFIEGFVKFYRNDKDFKYNHDKMLKLLSQVRDVEIITGSTSGFIKQQLELMYESNEVNI